MADKTTLPPATELAAKNKAHFPNETAEYRKARNTLLAEEIELRRNIERVAALRRALPLGGEVPENYTFEGENGAVRLSDLFGDKQSLVIYSMMFGPERKRPCPMCTAMLTSWDGTARNLRERVALAITARSPIDRILDFKDERGWQNLELYSDGKRKLHAHLCQRRRRRCPRTQHLYSPRRQDLSLLGRRDERRDGRSRPGSGRGAPDADPLWNILDLTPEGRGGDWYPKLEYAHAEAVGTR